MPPEKTLLEKFAKRVHRCHGCYIAFHMRDLWLSEGPSYFCENCCDDSMFSFDDFSRMLDEEQLAYLLDEGGEHHHH